MRQRIAPELVSLAVGLVAMCVGLGVRFGWEIMLIVVGALLVGLSAWSAAWADRAGGSR
jgi:hypothetical protein